MICCVVAVVEAVFNACDFKSLGTLVFYHAGKNACLFVGGNINTIKCIVEVVCIVGCVGNLFKLCYIAFSIFGNKHDVTNFNIEVFIGVDEVCYSACALTACNLGCCFAVNTYCGNLSND